MFVFAARSILTGSKDCLRITQTCQSCMQQLCSTTSFGCHSTVWERIASSDEHTFVVNSCAEEDILSKYVRRWSAALSGTEWIVSSLQKRSLIISNPFLFGVLLAQIDILEPVTGTALHPYFNYSFVLSRFMRRYLSFHILIVSTNLDATRFCPETSYLRRSYSCTGKVIWASPSPSCVVVCESMFCEFPELAIRSLY